MKMLILKRVLSMILIIMVTNIAFLDYVNGEVKYDGRSLIVNGQRNVFFSGSIHYPRSTPRMWPSLIAKARKGGIDVIQTYVFWNLHEPQPGQYDFEGNKDIVRFIKEIQAQGLFVSLRIGPFIQAEWSYGGLPFWLHDIPGIVFRSDNEPFKIQMQKFTTKIVDIMKSEKLYASQGGPIILSQIENEYQTVENAFGNKGTSYVTWASAMAVGLQTGVPWVMCKQDDAPDPVINTCNGMKCGQTFKGPNSPNKPSMWTENWTSRYLSYGQEAYVRPAEDIAYHVALFIASKNGSFVNYYMYHGGTNFGRKAAKYITSSYYDQAPLDEYGLVRQPKYGHLKELHGAIKLCSNTLLMGLRDKISIGEKQTVYVFGGNSGESSAFLVNENGKESAIVSFRKKLYELPAKSISILPDCKNVVFNTAKVNAQSDTRSMLVRKKFDDPKTWEEFKETIPNFDDTSIRSNTLLEHLNTTKDASDYLWYTFRFEHESSNLGVESFLDVNSHGHVLNAFVNGVFIGSNHGSHENRSFELRNKIPLNNGVNNVALLSVMVGTPDSGPFLESRFTGLRKVMIGDTEKLRDFTRYTWGYEVGLLGEKLQIFMDQGAGKVRWNRFSSSPTPLTWYKTLFDAPTGKDPVALNLKSMGKGEAWVNGKSIGRYWITFHTDSGSPSQIRYHVPRSFLKPKSNLLVLMEEQGGSPLQITLDIVKITNICGQVTSSHFPPFLSFVRTNNKTVENIMNMLHGREPKLQLKCPPRKKISKIVFSSFGNPMGNCESYSVGSCHSVHSKDIVERACLGKRGCSISISESKFSIGGDPCPSIRKSLLVEAECS